MAHPHHEHREHKKSHDRVHHILKEHPHGATKLAGGGSFSHVQSKHEAVDHEHKVSGKKAVSRFARGGKVKHGKAGHHTNIAIVVPQKGAPPGTEGPQAGAVPPPGPMAAPAPPPGMAGPPPGGMPPMPMRARGGKVIDGDSSSENLKKWGARTSKNSYARGGRLPTAGAMSGVERLQMTHKMKGK